MHLVIPILPNFLDAAATVRDAGNQELTQSDARAKGLQATKCTVPAVGI